jgi:hypothetical protein
MALPQNPNIILPVLAASQYLKAATGDDTFPSVPTLNAWRFEGKGPKYLKFGHRVFYRQRDLDEWVDRHIVDPSTRCA